MAHESTQHEGGGNTYRGEIERTLDEDTTRLGDVWRLREQDADMIARELGVPTSGFVYPCRTNIKAIVDGILPESPTLARQCASAIRGFLRRHPGLSAETHSILQGRADQCDRRTNDPERQAKEEQKLEGRTGDAESKGVPGIYVYTLPHYLRHPIEVAENDTTDDRTYLKVGESERDARGRVRDQGRNTALPEPLILLRLYVGPENMNIKEVVG